MEIRMWIFTITDRRIRKEKGSISSREGCREGSYWQFKSRIIRSSIKTIKRRKRFIANVIAINERRYSIEKLINWRFGSKRKRIL
jgi:hypothetical protein